MKTCPLFGKCGGCKFDFTSPNYCSEKLSMLRGIPVTNEPIWIAPGNRRRADFAFLDGVFGFFMPGTKNIVAVDNCPVLVPEINKVLPEIAGLPWTGAGGVLVTLCENGVDINVTAAAPYFTTEFKQATDKCPAIRVTWNDRVVKETATPRIKFGDVAVDYPPNGFLQPSVAGEKVLRDLVVGAAHGSRRIADLFCGLGNFTFALNADGFDIAGGIHRDLFKKPLTVQNLKKYDCVVMDPPRAGAMAQSKEIAKSAVARVVYVSCNPDTFMRDMAILTKGGYVLESLTPVDQFVGSAHWESVAVFLK